MVEFEEKLGTFLVKRHRNGDLTGGVMQARGNALLSSWNKARGLEQTNKPSYVDEDELIELELLELEEPDELLIEVSDDEIEPIPPKQINK